MVTSQTFPKQTFIYKGFIIHLITIKKICQINNMFDKEYDILIYKHYITYQGQ